TVAGFVQHRRVPALHTRRSSDLHTLSAIAEARLSTATTDTSTTVTGVTLRAHEVLPGDLFAALPGSRVHGAEFAAEAIAAGAARSEERRVGNAGERWARAERWQD